MGGNRLGCVVFEAVFAKKVYSNSYVLHWLDLTSLGRRDLQALWDYNLIKANLKPASSAINPLECRCW